MGQWRAPRISIPARTPRDCPDTVNGWHSPANASGICTWCGGKAEAKKPRPAPLGDGLPDDLELAYRRFWDPDWGTLATDVDPLNHRRYP